MAERYSAAALLCTSTLDHMAAQVLESRGTYIYCGYDEDNQEYELCMPEPSENAPELS